MAGSGSWGRAVYEIYRVASRAISPLLYLHVHWRRLRGLEHWSRWPERFGRPSARRPPGTLIWFHAVSLGEGLAAIPVINHCLQKNPNLLVLMTTTTVSAFEVIKERLPSSVIYQFAPVDTPMAMENFLVYWTPVAVILMESELWPNLIISASRKGITVALLNARMSYKSFRRWSLKISLPLISLMLSKFSLIVALSTAEAIRFQLLNAPPFIIHFAGDLKYAVGNLQLSQNECKSITRLKLQLYNRPVWMAASIHRGEEEVVISVHKELTLAFPNLVTILVTRNPQHGRQLAQALHKKGMHVALRTKTQMVSSSVNLYVVDTLEEILPFYHLSTVVFVSGMAFQTRNFHNIHKRSNMGCAQIRGPRKGLFSKFLAENELTGNLEFHRFGSGGASREVILILEDKNEAGLKTRQDTKSTVELALNSGTPDDIANLLPLLPLQQTSTFLLLLSQISRVTQSRNCRQPFFLHYPS
ncbi:hypothetical protein KSP39_PZI020855 [Platanthera zijinensis]|uniref:3-deoxy-D-manno-octulosonic-acid transferase N-terminal domain-containing protein n=1 Tax=Platanthera zijinensis TaxID=2320716 RepID=A0AAP0FXS0_9ASPA